jgi:hypothetical protein
MVYQAGNAVAAASVNRCAENIGEAFIRLGESPTNAGPDSTRRRAGGRDWHRSHYMIRDV